MKTIEAAQDIAQKLQVGLQRAYDGAALLAQLFVSMGIDETQIDLLLQEIHRANGRLMLVQNQLKHANK